VNLGMSVSRGRQDEKLHGTARRIPVPPNSPPPLPLSHGKAIAGDVVARVPGGVGGTGGVEAARGLSASPCATPPPRTCRGAATCSGRIPSTS
jgi:hypothetical protein